MERYYLGFDAGTQGVKVSVYDERMECVATSAGATTLSYPGPNMVEMDPDEYLALTIEGMRGCTDIMRSKGLDPDGIRSVFGDGIICGITGVDQNGDSITPFINYLDSRTQPEADRINSMDLDIWGEQTGNADASCMFPSLFAGWFLDNIPGFREKGAKFVHNAPYVLMHLAGLSADEAFIDQGAMSGWGLGYDVMGKRWSREQLDILGIDMGMMPRIVKPWDIIGRITPEVAEATGVPEGAAVCGGAGDTMQSMLGCGLHGPGSAADVAGTCSMFCVSTKGIVPELSKKGSGLIFNSGTLENTYFYWGFIRTGGLSLRWFKDNICQKADDSSYYRVLSEKAEEVPAGSNGVVFLPYLTGGTGEFKGASGMFLNMTLDDDQFVQWRAVLEAIGYDYMEITDTYRAAGVDLNRITVTEGGSRDSLWNQIKADMLNATVVRYRNAGGAVVTNCVFAAKAAGHIEDVRPLLEKTIIKDAEYTPNADNSTLYRKLFDLKTTLVKTDLQPAYATLMQMRETKVEK